MKRITHENRKEKVMKKRIFTGIILAGTVAVTAGLAGCGGQTKQAVTKDDLLEKAVDTFTKMQSMDADVKMDMAMNMSASGISMDMKNKADMNAVGIKDGATHVTGKMDVSALGQERALEVESYTVKEGTDMVQYSKVAESGSAGTWTKTTTNVGELTDSSSQLSVSQIGEAYAKLKDSLSDLTLQSGTVNYNNTNCYLVSGTVKGEKLAEIAGSSGQTIPEETKKSLEQLNIDTQLYFRADDETPYAIEADMADAIEKMMKAQSSSAMQGMEMTAEEMKMSVVFNSFDKVKDVTVPDDVKQNAVEGADALNVQSLLMGGGI